MVETAQKLPRSVQAKVDAANKIADQIEGKPPEAEASQAAMQISLSQPGAQTPEGAPAQPTQQAPAEQAPAQQAPQAPQTAEPWNNVAQLPTPEVEQRYRSMKGRHDAMEKRLEQATAQLEAAQQQMERMQAAVAAQQGQQPRQPTEQPAPPPATPWYTPEQKEEYGEEFFEMLEKFGSRLHQQQAETIKRQEQEIARLNQNFGQLQGNVQQVQAQPIYAVLDSKLPQWRQLNEDPAFLDWAEKTPVSDLTDTSMLTAMRQQFGRGSAAGVVKVFSTYLQNLNAAPQQSPPLESPQQMPGAQGSQPPVQAPQMTPAQQTPVVSMESLAGPGTPIAGQEPTGQEGGRVWTDASIAEFYELKRLNKLQPQQAAALEADLEQAISPRGRQAGRYRPR